jgi:hypothetical protein
LDGIWYHIIWLRYMFLRSFLFLLFRSSKQI